MVNLAVFQQAFYGGDDFVSFAAPVGCDEHVAGAFTAEAFDGGFCADNLDHFGDGFAVLFKFQKLEFACDKILGHGSAGYDVQRVNFDCSQIQVADHLGGALEIFHSFAREANDDVGGDGETHGLATLYGVFEFCQGVAAVDGGQGLVVGGLQADFHNHRLFLVDFAKVGHLVAFKTVRAGADGEARNFLMPDDGVDDAHQVLQGSVGVGVGLQVG